jgi:hypothetical protein
MKKKPPPDKRKFVLKRVDKTKDGANVPIYGIDPRAPKPCRVCKNEPRQPGSARGKICAAAHQTRQLEHGRLQKKINEQSK